MQKVVSQQGSLSATIISLLSQGKLIVGIYFRHDISNQSKKKPISYLYFIILKSPSSLLVCIETQVLGKRFELPSVFIAPIPCAEPPNHSTQCKNRYGSGPKDGDAYGTEVL